MTMSRHLIDVQSMSLLTALLSERMVRMPCRISVAYSKRRAASHIRHIECRAAITAAVSRADYREQLCVGRSADSLSLTEKPSSRSRAARIHDDLSDRRGIEQLCECFLYLQLHAAHLLSEMVIDTVSACNIVEFSHRL